MRFLALFGFWSMSAFAMSEAEVNECFQRVDLLLEDHKVTVEELAFKGRMEDLESKIEGTRRGHGGDKRASIRSVESLLDQVDRSVRNGQPDVAIDFLRHVFRKAEFAAVFVKRNEPRLQDMKEELKNLQALPKEAQGVSDRMESLEQNITLLQQELSAELRNLGENFSEYLAAYKHLDHISKQELTNCSEFCVTNAKKVISALGTPRGVRESLPHTLPPEEIIPWNERLAYLRGVYNTHREAIEAKLQKDLYMERMAYLRRAFTNPSGKRLMSRAIAWAAGLPNAEQNQFLKVVLGWAGDDYAREVHFPIITDILRAGELQSAGENAFSKALEPDSRVAALGKTKKVSPPEEKSIAVSGLTPEQILQKQLDMLRAKSSADFGILVTMSRMEDRAVRGLWKNLQEFAAQHADEAEFLAEMQEAGRRARGLNRIAPHVKVPTVETAPYIGLGVASLAWATWQNKDNITRGFQEWQKALDHLGEFVEDIRKGERQENPDSSED